MQLPTATGPFSPFFVSLIRAGEATGALELVLQRLAEHQERTQQLKDAILSAMLYPAILLVVAGSSLVVLLIYVVPQFQPMFEDLGRALPASTQLVILLAAGLRHYWWTLPLIGIGAYLTFVWLLAKSHWKALVDRLLINLPLLGDLVVRVELTRIFRTLGTMTDNGVTLLDSVRTVSTTTSNLVIANALQEASKALEQGRGLSQPLSDIEWFPPLAIQLIHVGEETGTLPRMLLKLADIYDNEGESALKRALALMEPVLILGLGLLIAFIIISILLGILGLNELVR